MEAPGRQFGKELRSSRAGKSLSDREFSLHIGKTLPYHADMRLQERGHQYQRGDDGVMSVSRLVRRMKNILEIEIGDVWVEGEVSNLRKQGNGHFYFSVKDDKAQLACAAFNAERRCSGHEALQDGARVRVLGEVTIYEARGQAQGSPADPIIAARAALRYGFFVTSLRCPNATPARPYRDSLGFWWTGSDNGRSAAHHCFYAAPRGLGCRWRAWPQGA